MRSNARRRLRTSTPKHQPLTSSTKAVAITGGIGAGKTEALRSFSRHGADRAAIAAIVFADPGELAWLEGLLHPKVVQEYVAWREQQTAPLAVTEVPLLYETGGDRRFDAIVVITASPEVRERRITLNDAREQRLIPDEEKIRRADFAYVNDGTLEELDAFVADVVARLTS